MLRLKRLSATALFCLGLSSVAYGEDFSTTIPMQDKGAHTYYVPAQISGFGDTELMVDTGSGYMTINEETLKVLKAKQKTKYIKDLIGILANGAELRVPVYRISELNLGGQCRLRNVDAAVFPGKQRLILGLSALSKAAPFIFSVNPPQLKLSNCTGSPT
jgi:predicted aspartyl protease